MSAVAAAETLDKTISNIVAAHAGREGALLPILHDVQHALGYVPEDAIPLIAEQLNLTRAEVFGVVSFYHDFRTRAPGKHTIRICRAEACQARGGAAIADHFKAKLGVDWGETTVDGAISLDATYCLGLCSVAPAAMADDEVYGRIDEKRLDALAERCRS